MTTSIGGTTGITFPDASTQNTAATGFGFKNRIINGAMTISQRGTSFSYTDGNNANYTLDRWSWSETGTSTGVQTISQDTSAPTGFVNSLKVQTTTAHSVGSGNGYNMRQWIEGVNIADLAWGTASAAPVAVSFWVKSSLTGTFAAGLQSSTFDRSYVFNYTISVANTWEYKTAIIPGPTSGTFATDTGRGLSIVFDLGTGSTYQTTAGSWQSVNASSTAGAVSVIGTLNATWAVTGVQLEKSSTATSFDYRPYGTELALCQRYYAASPGLEYYLYGAPGNTYSCAFRVSWPVTMRAAPTYTKTLSTSAYASVVNIVVTEAYAWDRMTATTSTNVYYYFSWTAAAEL